MKWTALTLVAILAAATIAAFHTTIGLKIQYHAADKAGSHYYKMFILDRLLDRNDPGLRENVPWLTEQLYGETVTTVLEKLHDHISANHDDYDALKTRGYLHMRLHKFSDAISDLEASIAAYKQRENSEIIDFGYSEDYVERNLNECKRYYELQKQLDREAGKKDNGTPNKELDTNRLPAENRAPSDG